MMQTRLAPHGANGTLSLRLGRWPWTCDATVIGGPYAACPKDFYGVCLVEREPAQYHVWLPIADFSVPKKPEDVEHAIKEVFHQLLLGREVYVGCMGGFGRTGLFLALLARAAGQADPIGYVRKNYTPRAVETPEQEQYVMTFPVAGIQSWLHHKARGAKLRRMFRWFLRRS